MSRSGSFRRSLKQGNLQSAVESLLAITPFFVASALMTIASGAALIWASGGFSHVRTSLLVGAGLSLLTFPLGAGVIRPTLLALERTRAATDATTQVQSLLRRFLLAHRAEGMLRVIALVLMAAPL